MTLPDPKAEERKLKATTLGYPAKPDGRGSARVNFCGRAYYFGAHNTLESFKLFGEWRRQMIETGCATEPKLLRIDLAHEQREADPASASPPIPAWQRHLLSIATALGIGILTGMVISSTNRGAAVDGVALSEEEQDFVRGIRLHQQNLANASQQRAERISELTMTLMEEGPNGKLHRSGQDM